MRKYAHIELLIEQHNYEDALSSLNTWERAYDQHVLMDNALVLRAEVYVMQGKIEAGIQTYHRVLQIFHRAYCVTISIGSSPNSMPKKEK